MGLNSSSSLCIVLSKNHNPTANAMYPFKTNTLLSQHKSLKKMLNIAYKNIGVMK